MKNFRIIVLGLLSLLIIAGCGKTAGTGAAGNDGSGKLQIVSTNFAGYDFARAVVGDQAEIKMLLKPGAESHSYEPSPADMLSIQNSDLFIYAGGDSDEWVEDVLESMDQSKLHVFRLMDAVELIEEEEEEGFAPGGHSHEHDHDDHDEDHDHDEDEVEMDEHVWTSPVNAAIIVEKLCNELSALDAGNAEQFQKNAEAYIARLKELDQEFRELVAGAARKEIIVADRFPFGYFVKEYGLSYYAAFPGCAADTQPSAKTVAFLQDKVIADQIPVVFHIELSNEDMCDAIAQDTGAKKELLYAIHNVSDEQFKAGVSYIDLMEHNKEVLKEALN